MSKVTVHNVAASAGVSASTVSRVLNKNHDISAATVATVERAIERLGYDRGATKRGRRPTRVRHAPPTASLALLIPDTHIEAMLTPLTGQLMHGIEAVARASGFNLLLTRLAEDGSLPPCLSPVEAQGLIVRSGDNEALERILPEVPTVWVFKPAQMPSRGDLVQPDNEAIGRMAAQYLLEHGHRHLVVVTVPPHHPEGLVRAESFERATQAEGAKVTKLFCPQADLASQLKRVIAKPPAGFFLPLGDEAIEVAYRALHVKDLVCGEGVDIISCNNDSARLWALDPRLPNLDICAEDIGRMAAETLLWRIQHPAEHRRCVLIAPRLVESASSTQARY